MTKTLVLPLKRKWYDMIASGEKKEEYREIKWYWVNRLMYATKSDLEFSERDLLENYNNGYLAISHFDTVTFTLGYPARDDMSRRMTYKIKGITIGEGKLEWGAEVGRTYFIIKLGERI